MVALLLVPSAQAQPQRSRARKYIQDVRNVSPLLDSANAIAHTDPSAAFDLVEEALASSTPVTRYCHHRR